VKGGGPFSYSLFFLGVISFRRADRRTLPLKGKIFCALRRPREVQNVERDDAIFANPILLSKGEHEVFWFNFRGFVTELGKASCK